MRKSPLLGVVRTYILVMPVFLVLISLLLFSNAPAATVNTVTCQIFTAETCASSVTGITVGGNNYNVIFAIDSFNNLNTSSTFVFIGDEIGAGLARDALVSELNLSLATRITDGSTAENGFLIPYNTDVDNTRAGNSGTPSAWFSSTDNLNLPSSYTGAPFAIFTPVPIPAAAWLFGSGLLGLIGVARHKV